MKELYSPWKVQKSKDEFDLDIGQIEILKKHRDRMDELMIETSASNQFLKAKYFNESQNLTRFINQQLK